ncbi:uncharacterized protein B0I36DRAFT_311323 [Microdochium trichocladiopsis]|uniref:Uncharacterized protein n=1 Tax=Microdochium trichocladiopsis TaxID=1682393 RepID=A0A9P8YIM6_9PEZI|nr:uncharacterized protein B0I36DRAFT_311323 [Microdochium trichocladiopsis]KAH7040718.1 hypothetical protein B0I36DRAFT_311323 [Microdochium trichocladiopsis]
MPRLSPRRLAPLLIAIGVFALFSLFFTLPGSIPATPSLSKTLADHKLSLPSIPKLPSLPNSLSSGLLAPFRPPAHAPPVQKNSTYDGVSWYSNWNWLSAFSSSITLDENRSLLPPLQERPAIYCYYDTSIQRDAKTKEAESELLLTWRRAWWSQGFRPVILSDAEATKNPLYDEVQRLDVESTFKKDLMRWLAWENMRGGILAHYRLFPMGDSHDPLLSFMRRGDFPKLTRWEGLSSRLFVGPKAQVTEVLTKALRSKKTKGVKDVIAAVEAADFQVDKQPAAVAYYDSRTVEQKYDKVAAELASDHASGLKSLNRLINAHLHNSWQRSFKKGIAVLKPLPRHTTRMVEAASDLAKSLSTCPTTPMPDSCPPNLPKCTPCSPKKPVKITTPATYRNTTDLFTIGTVPHPYTLQSLNSQRAYLNLTWIREESPRDLWLETVSKDLFSKKVSSSARLLRFKEAVAGKQTRYSSIWLTVERETPRDLEWWFGFDLHIGTEAAQETASTPKAKSEEKPKAEKRADDKEGATPAAPLGPASASAAEDVETDDERELQLLMKARAMRKTKDKNEIRIRNAIEAWNLADTEAWKFTKAFMARSRVERLKWEEEESKYAEGVGRDTETGAKSGWTHRWKDDPQP